MSRSWPPSQGNSTMNHQLWPPSQGDSTARYRSGLASQGKSTPGCKPYPGKRVVLLTVNEHYVDFLENWLLHAQPFWDPHTRLVVSAESATVAPMLRNLSRRSSIPFNVVVDESWTWSTEGAVRFREPIWSTVVTHRARQIANLVAAGCHVLYMDVDTVWRRPVFPILDKYIKSAELLVASDTPSYKCRPPPYHRNICTCFLYFSPTPGNLELLATWDRTSRNQLFNQQFFNDALRRKPNVTMTVLPFEQFPPGVCLETYNRTAVVVHANFVHGVRNKRKTLQRQGLWNVSKPQAP